MELTWYGHSCFRLAERNMATVVCDPYDHRQVGYESLKLKGDIITISHNKPGHNFVAGVKGEPYIISGPGEFEIGSVFITGFQTNGHTHKVPAEQRNTLYVIDYNGIVVVHLGGIDRVPTQNEVEDLGPVHIALVPVGGGSSLNASKAAETISVIEPNIVIPMHYATPPSITPLDPLSKFLKEMGINQVEVSASLKVVNVTSLPEETRVVVLDYPHSA